jgi:hypothetical protein
LALAHCRFKWRRLFGKRLIGFPFIRRSFGQRLRWFTGLLLPCSFIKDINQALDWR